MRFIATLLLCTVALSLRANIVINEVLTFNRNARANGVDYPDVIELYNTGATSVNVSGFALTDKVSTPTKYVIPSTTIIAAGGYLILFADSALASPGLHTSFGLNSYLRCNTRTAAG
jgi:hypothetical protein